MSMQTQSAIVEIGVGAVLTSGRAGMSAGRVALGPARLALRAPLVDRIATSPEVRDAISRQSETLANDVVTDVRTRREDADESIERHVRGWLRRPRPATP